VTARVAYLVRQYPVLSQTFITNEVAELDRMARRPFVVALEPTDHALQDEAADLVVTVDLDDRARGDATRWWKTRHPLRYARFRSARAALASELGRGPGKVDAATMPLVARRLVEQRIEVVHAHFGWQAAAAAWMVAELLDVPWSMTLHANDIFSQRRNLEAKIAAADEVVTVCEYNRNYLRDELGVTRDVHVVVCGVVAPDTADGRGDRDLGTGVVAVGRLVEKKGFDVLIAAVPELIRSHPDLCVTIVGDGPLRGALQRQIDHLDVAKHVELAGAAAHVDTLAAIASASVLCLPCRIAADGDRDSMPLVIKEAMVRGVPIVSTHEVGVPEMLDDSCGRLVPANDASALAGALAEILADDALQRRLGERARQVATERLLLSDEVPKLAALFDRMALA